MSKRLAHFLELSRSRPDYNRKTHQAEIAADLRILISRSGKNFKEVAQAAGISGPALSKKLSGESNLTLDSIVSIVQAVGADFDIIFRKEGEPHVKQQWDVSASAHASLDQANMLLDEIKAMHAEQKAMRLTWDSITRSMFRKKTSFSMPTTFTSQSICANDNSVPVTRAANGA